MFSGISGPKFWEILFNGTVCTIIYDHTSHLLLFNLYSSIQSEPPWRELTINLVPMENPKKKVLLKYVNTISVKPQNVWMVTHRVISLKNVSLIQIQIQSSNQTSTFKIITKPTEKYYESQWEIVSIPRCFRLWIIGRRCLFVP